MLQKKIMMLIIKIRRKYLIIGVTNTYILRRHSFPFFSKIPVACLRYMEAGGWRNR
jgi:hypothetical protein